MGADDKSKSSNDGNKSKKRRQRYLPHNRPVKKGSYPIRPGVQGFFLTCDGGREHQATREAINVIDSFYEELVHGADAGVRHAVGPDKPLNKITKFSDSDSANDDDSDDDNSDHHKEDDANNGNQTNKKLCTHKEDCENSENQKNEQVDSHEENNTNHENQADETEGTVSKKQRLETDLSKCGTLSNKVEEKSIDRLIEDELKELGDRNKRRFVSLESGCNGVVFVQMHKRDGDPGPVEIVQHMMTTAASKRKHMSRFILRVLPVEVTCYCSEEEIYKAIKPLISHYFPADAQTPCKFAVLYEARANTGVDRMAIINSVAKSVPAPHKVDLNNPDKTIIVQIVKTVCLIGVVEKYKELSKYNLRQLTSPK